MITRRSILAASSSSILLVPTRAMAQEPIAPPRPEEVLEVASDPKLYRQALIGFDALRLTLMLRLIELNQPSKDPQHDVEQYIEIFDPLQRPTFREEIVVLLSSGESKEIIIQTGNVAAPTAGRIQKALLEGGVSGPLGRDMVRGFYIVVQLKAVQVKKPVSPTDAWYCQVYPFSAFCPLTAGIIRAAPISADPEYSTDRG
jgi:hypothetical protein